MMAIHPNTFHTFESSTGSSICVGLIGSGMLCEGCPSGITGFGVGVGVGVGSGVGVGVSSIGVGVGVGSGSGSKTGSSVTASISSIRSKLYYLFEVSPVFGCKT